MMEKDKNKIDEVFKTGLGDPEFEFNESHWEDLESQLNKDSRLKKKKAVFYTIAATAAAAVLALFFTWKSDGPLSDRPLDKESEPTAAHKMQREGQEDAGTLDVPFVIPQQQEQSISFQPQERPVSSMQAVVEVALREGIQIADISDAWDTRVGGTFLNTVFSIPKMEYRAKELPNFNLKADPVETTGDRLAAIYQPKDDEFVAPLKKERSVISLLAGPDLTSVQGAGKSSLSENIGLAYSYPVAKGLNVSVGATYAKKNYKSAYKFYTPSNPPELTQLPSNVSAVCDVIDVPLTASYTVLKSKKVKFNVSAGLSSYFMLKEKYTFDYAGGGSYDGNQKSAVYKVSGENQHIFGVADFSISIEKKVNDKINLGVKPFVKLPLTGIGYGNVDLESKGVAFTLGVSL